MYGLLEMLPGPWTLHILCLLALNGTMRFGLLRRSISGISARLLTVRLRVLEKRGFICREVKPTKTAKGRYSPSLRLQDRRSVIK